MQAYRHLFGAVVVLGVLMGSVSPVAQAQQRAAGADATPFAEQQVRLERQDEQFRLAGWQVMHLVDFGQMGDLWDQASLIMKNLVTREEFVRQLVTTRIRLGTVVERSRPIVTRSASDGSNQTPQGLYLNVMSITRFAHHPEPVQELVSFRLDEDQTWRVTGYSVQ